MNEYTGAALKPRMPRFAIACCRPLLLAPLCFLLIASPASADWFYPYVEYECDKENDRLTVRFDGVYNDPEFAGKGPNRWSLWSLVTKDEERIRELKKITKICELSSGAYEVIIGPKPGAMLLTRRCGAAMGGWTLIKRGSEKLGQYLFDDNCTSPSYAIITEVTVHAKDPDRTEITAVPPIDFFK